MKNSMLTIIAFVSATFLLAFVPFHNHYKSLLINDFSLQTDTAWVAPASADEIINPLDVDEESLLDGKMVYRKNCNSCHGRSGNGKGSGAADLDVQPSDFTNPNFIKQSDGAIFWKTSEGRGEMKSYKSRLTEEEIWLVVTYIKTFSAEK